MKVLVTPIPGGVGPGESNDFVLRDLEATFPKVDFVWCETEEEKMAAAPKADVYCGWPSRAVYLAATNLKWIHCPGTGIDRILTIPELVESDIPITNARDPHVSPMATHVFGFIITLGQKFHEMIDQQKRREWRTFDYAWRQIDLEGQKLGILAFGNIGQRVAKRAQGFDMEVYAVDKFPQSSPYAKEVWGLDRVDELLAMSDWFVVTAPNTPETRNMIDRRRIGLMKPTAHLIVISRGGIVDEQALAEAVRSRKLAGAGLDATETEPPAPESPLWDTPNIVLTPHASAYTPSLFIGRRAVFKENLRRYLAGEPFLYVCDKQTGY